MNFIDVSWAYAIKALHGDHQAALNAFDFGHAIR